MEQLQTKKYQIILADPPWQYQDKNCNGNCEEHYETLNLEQLKKIPIKEISDENCALFLWATYPLLPQALDLINAWGFQYKSIAFQWLKLNRSGIGYFFGLGRWTRGNTEPCLLAIKGKPKRQSAKVSQLIISKIREHSRKPDQQYDLIEQLIGKLPRIELFAREHIQGWDVYGNQIPSYTQTIINGDETK